VGKNEARAETETETETALWRVPVERA